MYLIILFISLFTFTLYLILFRFFSSTLLSTFCSLRQNNHFSRSSSVIMTRNQRSTHERLDIAAYAKIQRRLKLNITFDTNFNFNSNAFLNSNVDSNSNVDFSDFDSNLTFAQFVFTSFFMRITFFTRVTISETRLSHEQKSLDDKKISRKIYTIKKKSKIIHLTSKFYYNFYDNFFAIL